MEKLTLLIAVALVGCGQMTAQDTDVAEPQGVPQAGVFIAPGPLWIVDDTDDSRPVQWSAEIGDLTGSGWPMHELTAESGMATWSDDGRLSLYLDGADGDVPLSLVVDVAAATGQIVIGDCEDTTEDVAMVTRPVVVEFGLNFHGCGVAIKHGRALF